MLKQIILLLIVIIFCLCGGSNSKKEPAPPSDPNPIQPHSNFYNCKDSQGNIIKKFTADDSPSGKTRLIQMSKSCATISQ